MVKAALVAALLFLPASVMANDYPSQTVRKTVSANKKSQIDAQHSLNPDCTSRGYPDVRLEGGPSHGQVSLQKGKDYPGAATTSDYAKCNFKPVEGTRILYAPERGYAGPDALAIFVIYPSGNTRRVRYDLTVK